MISPSQGLYLNTGQHKHRKTHTYTKHPCPEWDSNPRSRRPASEASSCLPLGYRDRPGGIEKFKLMLVFNDAVCIETVRRRMTVSHVLVTNNAGPGLDERVYLLLIHTTSNYKYYRYLHFIVHCYTHTSRLLVMQLKHRNYKSLIKSHTTNITVLQHT
jgi:hypothetical protein